VSRTTDEKTPTELETFQTALAEEEEGEEEEKEEQEEEEEEEEA